MDTFTVVMIIAVVVMLGGMLAVVLSQGRKK